MLDLLGVLDLEPSLIQAWLPEWKQAFETAVESSHVDPRIHPARLNYYEKAIRAILESEHPRAALWPLMQTWTLAAEALSPDALVAWRAACDQLGLTSARFEERVNGLDRYLDEVEAWGIEALEACVDGVSATRAVHICYGYGTPTVLVGSRDLFDWPEPASSETPPP